MTLKRPFAALLMLIAAVSCLAATSLAREKVPTKPDESQQDYLDEVSREDITDQDQDLSIPGLPVPILPNPIEITILGSDASDVVTIIDYCEDGYVTVEHNGQSTDYDSDNLKTINVYLGGGSNYLDYVAGGGTTTLTDDREVFVFAGGRNDDPVNNSNVYFLRPGQNLWGSNVSTKAKLHFDVQGSNIDDIMDLHLFHIGSKGDVKLKCDMGDGYNAVNTIWWGQFLMPFGDFGPLEGKLSLDLKGGRDRDVFRAMFSQATHISEFGQVEVLFDGGPGQDLLETYFQDSGDNGSLLDGQLKVEMYGNLSGKGDSGAGDDYDEIIADIHIDEMSRGSFFGLIDGGNSDDDLIFRLMAPRPDSKLGFQFAAFLIGGPGKDWYFCPRSVQRESVEVFISEWEFTN